MCTFPISPSYIAPTSLGHTLIHIACLPLSAAHIRACSLAVSKSTHDTRSLAYYRSFPITPRGLGTSQFHPNPPETKQEENYHTSDGSHRLSCLRTHSRCTPTRRLRQYCSTLPCLTHRPKQECDFPLMRSQMWGRGME